MDIVNGQMASAAQIFQLPSTASAPHVSRMQNDAQNKLIGRALKGVRLDAGMTLQVLGDKLNRAKQTISAWENGAVALTDSHLDEFLAGVGGTRAALEAKLTQVGGQIGAVVAFEPQPWFKAYPESLGELVLNTDDLAPWAERGEKVLYERDRHPLREQACVVDMKDGATLARFFVKSSDGRAYLRSNTSDKLEDYLWDEIRGIHRIVLRGS